MLVSRLKHRISLSSFGAKMLKFVGSFGIKSMIVKMEEDWIEG